MTFSKTACNPKATEEKRARASTFLLSFFIPFMAIAAVFLFSRPFPFGMRLTVLGEDSLYLSYLSGLHRLLFGADFYEFSSLLSETASLHARYLGSPLTWLHALAPTAWHVPLYFFVFALRAGLVGLSAATFFGDKHFALSPLPPACLASAFAVLTALASLSDGLTLLPEHALCLPLLLSALFHFIRTKRVLPLVLSFTFALLTGYALFYIVLPMFFLFGALCILEDAELSAALCNNRTILLLSVLIALFCACLLASPLLFASPSGIGENLAFRSSEYHGSLLYRPLLLALSMLPGSSIANLPFLFSGMIALFLFPFYFFSKKYALSHRLLNATVLLSFFIFFLFFNPLGGAFSPFFTFFLLLLAARLTKTRAPHFRRALACISAAFILIVVLLQKLAYQAPNKDGVPTEFLHALCGVYLPLLLCAAILPLLSLLFDAKTPRKSARSIAALLLLLTFFDMALSTHARLIGTDGSEKTVRDAVIIQDGEKSGAALTHKFFKNNTDEKPVVPYRTAFFSDDTTPFYTKDFSWISEKTPLFCFSDETLSLLTSLGENTNTAWTHRTADVTDALFGIRFTLSKEPLPSVGYSEKARENGLVLYQTETCLPLVFLADKGCLHFQKASADTSPYHFTNAFFSALLGYKTDVYKPLSAHLIEDRLTKKETPSGTLYRVQDKQKGGLLHMSAKTDVNGGIYFNPRVAKGDAILAAGQARLPLYTLVKSDAIYVGALRENRQYSAVFHTSDTVMVEPNEPLFYQADLTALSSLVSSLSKRGDLNTTLFGDTLHVTAKTEGDSLLMTTLPYSANFSVKANGDMAECENVEGLLAVHIPSGTSSITITRTQKWDIPPLLLIFTALGIICTTLLSVYHRRRSKAEVSFHKQEEMEIRE